MTDAVIEACISGTGECKLDEDRERYEASVSKQF